MIYLPSRQSLVENLGFLCVHLISYAGRIPANISSPRVTSRWITPA